MKSTLEQLAVIERRDVWIRRLSQLFFAALFALILTGAIVAALAFILGEREQTQRDSRAAASRRIDLLTRTVEKQAAQIAGLQGRVGALTTAQGALVAQLRQHDLEPVVIAVTPRKTADPTPTPSPATGARPSPAPRPSATSSPRPSPSPSPTPTCRVFNPVNGRCLV